MKRPGTATSGVALTAHALHGQGKPARPTRAHAQAQRSLRLLEIREHEQNRPEATSAAPSPELAAVLATELERLEWLLFEQTVVDRDIAEQRSRIARLGGSVIS